MTPSSPATLDPTTFIFCMAVIGYLMAAISFSTASTCKDKALGLHEWGVSMLLLGTTFMLLFFRGYDPDLLPPVLTVMGANLLVILVPLWGSLAHARFFNRVPPLAALGTLAAFGGLGVVLPYLMDWPRSAVVFSVSSCCSAMFLYIAYLLLRPSVWRNSPVALISGVSVLLMCIAMGARALYVVLGASDNSALYAKSGTQVGFFVTAALSAVAASMGFILMAQDKLRRDIVESARRDGLTGLYNRAAFFEAAGLLQADSNAKPYAVLMVDIDHFKRINDTHGHPGGDVALMHAARMIQGETRSTDLAARYGGEEFCILLKDCAQVEAQSFADRLVLTLGAHPVRLKGGVEIAFTVSVGYAWQTAQAHPLSVSEMLELADKALYRAKNGGRNQAQPAAMPPPPPAPAPFGFADSLGPRTVPSRSSF
ncbi:MAG: GGDEF domain-containing protein [Pseudomonadota bacterium]